MLKFMAEPDVGPAQLSTTVIGTCPFLSETTVEPLELKWDKVSKCFLLLHIVTTLDSYIHIYSKAL